MNTTTGGTRIRTGRRLRAPWVVVAWKELRENTVWALLGMVGLALALSYEAAQAFRTPVGTSTPDFFWNNVNTALALGAPKVALAFGLLQTIPEQRRDVWAFIAHRPLPRTSLFWGKATAGLALYALTALVPFILCVMWAKSPGNLPCPFSWHLACDGLAAIFAGIPFYFAGILAGLRPAAWFGSRALPILAAMIATPHSDVWSRLFWTPTSVLAYAMANVVATAVAIMVFAVAARAAYATQGLSDNERPGPGLAIASVALLGALVGVSLVATVLLSVEDSVRNRAADARGVSRQYSIQPSGEILERDERLPFGPVTFSYVRDADGRPMTGEAKASGRFYGHSERIFSFEQTYPDIPRYQFLDRPGALWFLDSGRRKFIGYGFNTFLPSRVLGPAGEFRASESARAGEFAMPILWVVHTRIGDFAIDGGQAYFLAPGPDAPAKLMLPLNGEKLVALRDFNPLVDYDAPDRGIETPLRAAEPAVLAMTPTRFFVLSKTGNTLFTIPREFGSHSYPTVSVAWARQGNRLLVEYVRDDQSSAAQVSVWTGDGRHLSTFALNPIANTEHKDLAAAVLAGVFPPLLEGGIVGWANAVRPSDILWYFTANRVRQDRAWMEKLVASAIAGLVCAGIGFASARRRALPGRACLAWSFALFWLGIPGLIMMLSLVPLPARVVCSACGRTRIVTRDLCEHCSAPFPGPVTDGTEIFGGSATPSMTLNNPASSMAREELTR